MNISEVEKKVYEYKSNNPGGIYWRISKHCKVIEKHLNPDEEILFAFPAQTNDCFYNIFTTSVIVLTRNRLIVAQKRVLWGYFFKSITPEMFNDISVYQGLFWGRVEIDTIKEKIILTNVAKLGLDDIETNITMNMSKNKQVKKNETI